MHYVYVLYLKNGDLYKGETKDLERRLQQHQRGAVDSTSGQDPQLIHYECYKRTSDATRREQFLKTTEGRRLLRQQLRDILNQLRAPLV